MEIFHLMLQNNTINYSFFSKIPNKFQQFNELDRISPLYHVDGYAKQTQFKLEVAYKIAQQFANIRIKLSKKKLTIRIF